MFIRAVAISSLTVAAAALPSKLSRPDAIEAAAERIIEFNRSVASAHNVGIVNGRTTEAGEWEGTVMVVGSTGDCDDAGLCTGMFIHPEVVMSAGHCCASGDVKAICGGKERPGVKLAQSVDTFADNFGFNDFCLIHLDRAVTTVPIYQVAVPDDVFAREDAIIVGYGVSNSGLPQLGAGTQREGLVQITRTGGILPPGIDIFVTGRTGMPYQNACNGDSGGPIFMRNQAGQGLVVGGVTSRGGLFCPANSEGIYTSAVQDTNLASITTVTREWLGAASEIVPGVCPVTQCCYEMRCD